MTPREPVPAPSPRRLVNVNVTVPPAAQVGRRSHEPVIVSPLVLSPQLHTIPLTVENIQACIKLGIPSSRGGGGRKLKGISNGEKLKGYKRTDKKVLQDITL